MSSDIWRPFCLGLNELTQDWVNAIPNTLQFPQFCTKPLIFLIFRLTGYYFVIRLSFQLSFLILWHFLRHRNFLFFRLTGFPFCNSFHFSFHFHKLVLISHFQAWLSRTALVHTAMPMSRLTMTSVTWHPLSLASRRPPMPISYSLRSPWIAQLSKAGYLVLPTNVWLSVALLSVAMGIVWTL